MVFFRFWAVSIRMIAYGIFLLFFAFAYAADTPPKGLVLPPQLKADIARMEEFITASQPIADFMDHETRIVQNLGIRAPAFDTSVINDDLFNAIQRVRNQVPALIDGVTTRRAGDKINMYRIDEANQRFIRPPYQTLAKPSETIFNINPPPSERNTLFPKTVTPLLRQKMPMAIIRRLDSMADQFSFLQKALADAQVSNARAQSILGMLLTEGVATPAQIDIAWRGGMITTPMRRAIEIYTANNTRDLLMRPRPFGVEPTGVVPLSPSISSAKLPVTTQIDFYPSPSSLESDSARRTLARYPQTKILPKTYMNPLDKISRSIKGTGAAIFSRAPTVGTLWDFYDELAGNTPDVYIAKDQASIAHKKSKITDIDKQITSLQNRIEVWFESPKESLQKKIEDLNEERNQLENNIQWLEQRIERKSLEKAIDQEHEKTTRPNRFNPLQI